MEEEMASLARRNPELEGGRKLPSGLRADPFIIVAEQARCDNSGS